VGKIVTDLTGITDDMLKQKGVSFFTAMSELKKYCGLSFKKSSFITFGNHDMKILSSSISYSFDFPKEIVQCIQQNYIDFSAFIGEFMRDDKGNPLSLIKYCDAFGVPQAGPAHDPAVDAENLARLYDATMRKSAILIDEYKKVLKSFNHFPSPVSNVIKKLANDENVTAEEFEKEIKDYLA
jgi:inhibitor of KinA sporulation pathway (predicted exonuclease)